MAASVYELKLKTGFFKTELYNLSVCNEQITLEQKENKGLERFILHNRDIYLISIVKKKANTYEIEINAQQGAFVGILFSNSNLEELFYTLKKEFDGKVII